VRSMRACCKPALLAAPLLRAAPRVVQWTEWRRVRAGVDPCGDLDVPSPPASFAPLCADSPLSSAVDRVTESGREVILVGDLNISHGDLDVFWQWTAQDIYCPGVSIELP